MQMFCHTSSNSRSYTALIYRICHRTSESIFLDDFFAKYLGHTRGMHGVDHFHFFDKFFNTSRKVTNTQILEISSGIIYPGLTPGPENQNPRLKHHVVKTPRGVLDPVVFLNCLKIWTLAYSGMIHS